MKDYWISFGLSLWTGSAAFLGPSDRMSVVAEWVSGALFFIGVAEWQKHCRLKDLREQENDH